MTWTDLDQGLRGCAWLSACCRRQNRNWDDDEAGENLKTNLLRIRKLHDCQRGIEDCRIISQRQRTCAVSSWAAVGIERLLEDLALGVLVVDLLDVVAAPAGYA